jgi:DNA-binding MarR family transcriptional regulator
MKFETDCGMTIKRINDIITWKANREIAGSGITLSQLRYMNYLDGKENKTAKLKDLEHHFGASQPTVSGIVHRLCRKGLLLLSAAPCGGRTKTAALTEKGLQLLRTSEKSQKAMEEQLLSPLTAEEKKQFQSLLQKVYKGLCSLESEGK